MSEEVEIPRYCEPPRKHLHYKRETGRGPEDLIRHA